MPTDVDRESTFFKLVAGSLTERGCDLHVDLHQTEFAKSTYNAMIILPFSQEELPEKIRLANREAAKAIIEAWRKMNAQPMPEARPLGYGEDQLRYFRKCWGAIYRSFPHVTVEVQNNNVRTSPMQQRHLIETSIRAAVAFVMGQGN
jgi:hypothetical protein